ncbi:uncharacterized protein LOC143449462 isoform X2 [Clavelina lepadiformis]|uniref:uncharacterized protein LOC143449462 isoform X2 n=1 Tax=Clavelina lepadiformis TaxID=159417 RepID=UPI004040F534
MIYLTYLLCLMIFGCFILSHSLENVPGNIRAQNSLTYNADDDPACRISLMDDDILCGTRNTTALRCYINRIKYTNPTEALWVNFCVFRLETEDIRQFECSVLNEFGPVSCTPANKNGPPILVNCSFTFKKCQNRNVKACVARFSAVHEDGGLCAKQRLPNNCPSDNLHTLDKIFVLDENKKNFYDFTYGDLQSITIRPPKYCLTGLVAWQIILLCFGLIGIFVGIFLAIWKIRKEWNWKIDLDNDPIIKRVAKTLKDPSSLNYTTVIDKEKYCAVEPIAIARNRIFRLQVQMITQNRFNCPVKTY